MKIIKISLIVLVAIFAAMQVYRIDQTNPPIAHGETIEAVVDVPADVSQILSRSCGDCHSHKTVYPWYANISPVSVFLEDHILQGRAEMNLSKFATYNKDKQVRLLEEICDEVNGRQMPLPSYLWIHSDAVLTDVEIAVLCGWSKAARAVIESRN